MISPNPSPTNSTQPQAIHLIAPPSTRSNQSTHTNFGRTTPCLLLAGALKNKLTPPHPHSQIYTIGDATTKYTAIQLGLPISIHLTPILSNPNSLKRQLLKRLNHTNTTPSRIICWSDELIHLASTIGTRYEIPTELISTKPATITKPPQSIDTIRVFVNQDHDLWQNLRHTCQTDQLLAPLINPSQPSRAQRAAARAQFNIDDQTIVIAAIADTPNEVDAREFAFLLGLLSVSGYKVLGIVPKTAKNLTQALRHHRGLNQPFRLLTTTDPLPKLLPLLDTYIHPNDHISGSTHLIDRLLSRAEVPILNLRHSGKAGFSRAQGTAGKLLNEMDQIVQHMQSQLI